MAYVSVSNTFVNGAVGDANQVNTNFTDLVNGLSDGTKNILVKTGSFASGVESPYLTVTSAVVGGRATIATAVVTGDVYTTAWADITAQCTFSGWDAGASTSAYGMRLGQTAFLSIAVTGTITVASTPTITLPASFAASRDSIMGFLERQVSDGSLGLVYAVFSSATLSLIRTASTANREEHLNAQYQAA